MKKEVVISIFGLLFPLMISAQASGGHIVRKKATSVAKKKVENSTYSPRIIVINEKEKICELAAKTIKSGAGSYEDPCIIQSYKGAYTIPSKINGYTVVRIGNNAFSRCGNLTSLKIPSTVKEIGEFAFQYCTSLTEVEIGGKIKSLSKGAFYFCSSLEKVKLPEGLLSIGESAFAFCNKLAAVYLPSTLISIGEHSFNSCGFASISIPSSVKNIEKGAFYGSQLQSIIIPSSISVISDDTF